MELISNSFEGTTIQGYNCQHCLQEVIVSKRENIIKFPEILVVNIKRFEFFPFARKLVNNVILKEEIDLKEFFVDWTDDLSKKGKGFLGKEKENGKYKLKAFVEHSGRINVGHYYSYCYSEEEKRWLIFNDDRVSRVYEHDPVEEMESDAYVLFFEKI